VDYKELLAKLNKNLNILRERAAKFGGDAPLELINQISDHEEAILLTEQAIEGELTQTDWEAALQPLLVAIEARGGETASSVTIGDIDGGIHQSTVAGGNVTQTTINVVGLLGDYLPDQGRELAQEAGPTASAVVQKMLELVLEQVKTEDPRTAQKYPENPAGYQAPLQDVLSELLELDRGLATRLTALLNQYDAAAKSYNRTIDTEGGSYVEGDVEIDEGDFIGRDKVVQGNNSVTYILNQFRAQKEHRIDQATLRRQIDNYLTWLRDRTGIIELRGIKREGQQVMQLPLNEVYVPLEAMSFENSKSIGLYEILSLGRQIVITGGPGSGKTTVLLHIAWTLATAISKDTPAFAQERLGLKDTLIDDLKTILKNTFQVIKEDWLKSYSDFENVSLNEAIRLASQLAQIGPSDALLDELKAAQTRLNLLRPIVTNANKILRAAQLFKELEEVKQKVEELGADDEDEIRQSLIEKGRELTLAFHSIWETTDEFMGSLDEKDGQTMEERIVQVGGHDISQAQGKAEQQILANTGVAEQIKAAVEKAWKLIQTKKDSLPLPIFVPLSAYATYLRRLSDPLDPHDATLATFISRYLIEKQASYDLPRDFFKQVLQDGRAVILLLDGLDEVASEAERVRVREAIEDLVTGRPTLWVIVTCRTVAYKERTALGKDFQEVRVQPLNDFYLEKLVQQACFSIYRSDPTARKKKTEELLDGIKHMEQHWQQFGGKIERLISSPLLVRMLLVVHFSERQLPEQRAELFMRATDAILLPEYLPDQTIADQIGRQVGGSKEIHRDLAQYLAFTMHCRGENQGLEISENELRRILEKEPSYLPLIDDFIDLTRQRGTLLEERLGMYRFIHLAFQEFMVARYLAEDKRSEEKIAEFFLRKTNAEKEPILDTWWREPALLVVGYLSVNSPRTAHRVLRYLAGIDQTVISQISNLSIEKQLGAIEVAIIAYLEWSTANKQIGEELAERLDEFLTSSVWPPVDRSAAGDILAQLGDPRPGVGLCPDGLPNIFWKEVPDGKFIMGSKSINNQARHSEVSKKALFSRLPDGTTQERLFRPDNDEFPQWTVEFLPAFRISRYPITNAQYAAFVQDGGYEPEKGWQWWTKAGWTWKGDRIGPKTYGSVFDLSNHPIVGVSWYEAVAFCKWLTERFKDTGKIGPNEMITLPNEKQWEKAARGIDDRHYPWGNEVDPNRANYIDSGIGKTSPVGCFPDGASCYCCEEMSGNVWEWCQTKWQDNYLNYRDDNDNDGDEARVLRGGSFASYWLSTRCSVRSWAQPSARDIEVGFRVVLAME
jgi:formylglycine-generating enzyme required for sulfatase activity